MLTFTRFMHLTRPQSLLTSIVNALLSAPRQPPVKTSALVWESQSRPAIDLETALRSCESDEKPLPVLRSCRCPRSTTTWSTTSGSPTGRPRSRTGDFSRTAMPAAAPATDAARRGMLESCCQSCCHGLPQHCNSWQADADLCFFLPCTRRHRGDNAARPGQNGAAGQIACETFHYISDTGSHMPRQAVQYSCPPEQNQRLFLRGHACCGAGD